MRTFSWVLVAIGLGVTVGLPLAGHWLRRGGPETCAMDGAVIEPAYHVRIVAANGGERKFCCIRCAELWLEHGRVKPRGVYVTDERSGREIDARRALYVRSLVVSVPTVANRIHAFLGRADAEAYAANAGGALLSGPERPFADH